jgi:hypothetical protein
VNENTALWLAGLLTANVDVRLTRTGRLIAREIAEDTEAFENEALATLAASLSNLKSVRNGREAEPPCVGHQSGLATS